MKAIDLATLVFLGALWGSSYFFIRVAAPAFGPLPLMFGRVVIAGVLLWGASKILGQPTLLKGSGRKMLTIGFLNSALPFSLIAAAELHITASLAAVLGATVPFFGAMLSVLWLGERITAERTIGAMLGVAGVAIIAGWSPAELTSASWLSIAAVLVGSLSYAGAGIYAKRELKGIPPFTIAFGQQVAAAAILMVPALAQASAIEPTRTALASMMALGLFCTSLAFVLYYRLIARIGPMKTQTVTYIVPIFGMFWGAVFLGEKITGAMLGGFVCIVASIALVSSGSLSRHSISI